MVDGADGRKARQAVMEGLGQCEDFFFCGLGDEGMHVIAHAEAEVMGMMVYEILKENPAAWRSMRSQNENRRLPGCASWCDTDEVGFQLNELPEDYQDRFKSWIIESLKELDIEQGPDGEEEGD